MGYSLISQDVVYVGYELSYEDVFENTILADQKVLFGERDGEFEVEEGDENNSFEELLTKYDPHVRLATAWKNFVEEKHPNLKDFNIKTYIGCKSVLAEYETRKYTKYCSVVFGYVFDGSVDLVDSDAPDVMKCQFPSKFVFPNNMPDLIKEFGQEFNNCDWWRVCKNPDVVFYL